MRISQSTLEIFKNFSTINSSICIKSGSIIKTVSPSKTILAKAEIMDTFPRDFAIYDLNRFLGVISIFENPEFDFQEKQIAIKESVDNKKINTNFKYTYTDPALIVSAPEKDLSLDDSYGTVATIEQAVFKTFMKAVSIGKFPELAFVSDGAALTLRAFDSSESTRDVYEIELGPCKEFFTLVIKEENIKLLPQDYYVEISPSRVAKFIGLESKISYWVAGESSSKF